MHQNLVGIFPQTGKQLETQYACHIGSKPIITPPNIGNLAKKKTISTPVEITSTFMAKRQTKPPSSWSCFLMASQPPPTNLPLEIRPY